MTEAPKNRRKPVLLIVVVSLAVASIVYLEFFADPIIDPPEFFTDGHVQIQYLVARSPFSRRGVSKVVTVDWLGHSSQYEFRGRDVLIGQARVASDCVILAGNQVHVGSAVTRDLLWDQRGYVRHLRERSMNGGFCPFLSQVAEETGDLHLARMVSGCIHHKMD